MPSSGILLINKPESLTSHGVVAKVRKLTGIRKIGHAGTLDPFAQGLLVILVGREATKQQVKFLKKDKEYLATLRLGLETTTYDKEGKIHAVYDGLLPSKKEIKQVLQEFKGTFFQVPPLFSAKKIKGRKAYELARQGKSFALKPVKVKIKKLKLLGYQPPYLKLKIRCSAGTYIRSLARDIGRRLGCGAYLKELTRTRSGNFKLKDAVCLERLSSEGWQNFLLPLEK